MTRVKQPLFKTPGKPYVYQNNFPETQASESAVQATNATADLDRVLAETLIQIQSGYISKGLDKILEDTLKEIQFSYSISCVNSRCSYLSTLRENAMNQTDKDPISLEEQEYFVFSFLRSVLGEDVLGNIADYSL